MLLIPLLTFFSFFLWVFFFNAKGHGKYLWIMQGMFRSNGGCGYVKKPQFLLDVGPNNEVFDPNEILPVKTTLQVHIYNIHHS